MACFLLLPATVYTSQIVVPSWRQIQFVMPSHRGQTNKRVDGHMQGNLRGRAILPGVRAPRQLFEGRKNAVLRDATRMVGEY